VDVCSRVPVSGPGGREKLTERAGRPQPSRDDRLATNRVEASGQAPRSCFLREEAVERVANLIPVVVAPLLAQGTFEGDDRRHRALACLFGQHLECLVVAGHL
jgi:hypothetical protein